MWQLCHDQIVRSLLSPHREGLRERDCRGDSHQQSSSITGHSGPRGIFPRMGKDVSAPTTYLYLPQIVTMNM